MIMVNHKAIKIVHLKNHHYTEKQNLQIRQEIILKIVPTIAQEAQTQIMQQIIAQIMLHQMEQQEQE